MGVLMACVRRHMHTMRGKSERSGRLPKAGVGMGGRKGKEERGWVLAKIRVDDLDREFRRIPQVQQSGGKVPA